MNMIKLDDNIMFYVCEGVKMLKIISNGFLNYLGNEDLVKDDGSSYTYKAYPRDSSSVIYYDDINELVAYYIDQYESLNNGEKFLKRYQFLTQKRVGAVAEILAHCANQDNLLSQEEMKILSLNVPAHWNPEGLDIWSSKVPLILVAQDYYPYSDITRPVSINGESAVETNIIWIDALNDETFVESLVKIGLLSQICTLKS